MANRVQGVRSLKRLTIVTYFTKPYTYAVKAQARRVLSNLQDVPTDEWEIHFVACTDKSEAANEAFTYYSELLKDRVTAHQVFCDYDAETFRNEIPYKEESQLLIAQMTQAVLDKAKLLQSDYTWILEADILPAPNALRCLLDVLRFDAGYYDIAFSPYPSNGGGSFLGGFGSPTSHIHKDFLPNERKVTKELTAKFLKSKKEEAQFAKDKVKPPEQWIKERLALEAEIEACPPDGNIWQVNAKHGWRRRGWLDQAYPAISKGMIVPVDWCGTGNTMLSRKALAVSSLDGYHGKGTQDLFLIWNRWYPVGLRIGLTTQALSDHIVLVREKGKEGKRTSKNVHLFSYYETQGEAAGHIRWKPVPWYSAELGETYDPDNDGSLQQLQIVKDA